MPFEKTVEALIAGSKTPAPKPLVKFETSKALSKAFGRDLQVPTIASEKQFREAVQAVRGGYGKTSEAFAKLSPLEKRKVSALVHVATHGGKISDAFKALPPGSFKGSAGTSEQLKKGLALAKAQKLNLDATTW